MVPQVTSPYGNSMHYAENVQSGHFAFTATEAGDYLACFWAPDHKPPVTIGFEFDWRSGVSAKDWPSVAKKGKVDVSISPSGSYLGVLNSLPIWSSCSVLPCRFECCGRSWSVLR
jgi:hypothetical protein